MNQFKPNTVCPSANVLRFLRIQGLLLSMWTTGTAVLAQTCNANIPPTRPDSRYETVVGTSPAGSEVRDKVTGLIWQRCVVGMTWDGATCTGTPSSLNWQNALEAARTATASIATAAKNWRLPNHAELYSLAERACHQLAINTTWFVATPSSPTWSSSPYASGILYAWSVSFDDGGDYYADKDFNYKVRLVRSIQ